MQTWLCLGVAIVISVLTLRWLRQRRTWSLLEGLPSYPGLPLIGNFLELWGDGENLFRRVDDMSKKADDAMKPFLLWLAGYPLLLFSDPDDVRIICNTFIAKPYYYNFGKDWLGDGLVTAPVHIWKKNIKKLAGSFNATVVENNQDIFNAQAQKLVQKLKGKVGAEPFDALHIIAYITLETICETALGVSEISSEILTGQYYSAFERALQLLIARGLSAPLHVDAMYRLTAASREYQRCLAVIRNVADTVLKKKMMERKMNGNQTNGDQTKEKQTKSFIDILLDLQATDPELTAHQITSEVNTVLVGGQETTASTLFYALVTLGKHPQEQQKLYDELESIFEGSNRAITKEDLSRMSYCEAVIYEVLRLYPPLPAVVRLADREIKLKSCTVPVDTMCCINVWGAGRSTRAWGAQAARFQPERWTGQRDPAAFLPFSYGRRACIGKKYAIAVLKTMLAYCVRELRFSCAGRLRLKMDVALRPVDGHLIRVQFRD